MTLATALVASAAPARQAHVRGWRSRYPGDFPSLGWLILDWTFAFLPSPTDEHAPFVFTPEQARRVVRMYALDPLTGERLYRRVHEEEAKGWGKSPIAAAIALAEFCGPVCFDGWDANGQPVGMAWGTRGREVPWVQIAAVSEAQTENTYASLYGFLTANDHRAAIDLGIDEGRTRLYLRRRPAALLERVTASAGTREGQRVTHAVGDEPQLWTPSNDGDELARVITRNTAKTGGWTHFTGNAPVLGLDSVAETYGTTPSSDVLHLANRLPEEPQPEWTDDQLVAGLRHVYGDARWISTKRLLAEIRDSATPWTDSLRFYFNVRVDGRGSSWIPLRVWEEASGDVVMRRDLPAFACVTVAHDHRSAAVAVVQKQGEELALRVVAFPQGRLPEGEVVDVDDLEGYLRGLRRRYPAAVATIRQGRRTPVAAPGPEIVYHGAFFAPSAQRLERERLVLVDVPDTNDRLAPAAETLKGAALDGRLIHDGSPELASQIGNVKAVPTPTGWRIDNAGPAVRAAIVATHRALSAPPAPAVPTLRHGAPR